MKDHYVKRLNGIIEKIRRSPKGVTRKAHLHRFFGFMEAMRMARIATAEEEARLCLRAATVFRQTTRTTAHLLLERDRLADAEATGVSYDGPPIDSYPAVVRPAILALREGRQSTHDDAPEEAPAPAPAPAATPAPVVTYRRSRRLADREIVLAPER